MQVGAGDCLCIGGRGNKWIRAPEELDLHTHMKRTLGEIGKAGLGRTIGNTVTYVCRGLRQCRESQEIQMGMRQCTMVSVNRTRTNGRDSRAGHVYQEHWHMMWDISGGQICKICSGTWMVLSLELVIYTPTFDVMRLDVI